MPVHIENSWRDEVELGGKDGGKKRREACERKKNEKARKEGGFANRKNLFPLNMFAGKMTSLIL